MSILFYNLLIGIKCKIKRMSKINNLLVVFVTIFVATAATAQTIAVKGVVTDTADVPIYNSNVVLMQNGEIVCGTIIKADGDITSTPPNKKMNFWKSP